MTPGPTTSPAPGRSTTPASLALNERALRKLQQVRLVADKLRSGRLRGERRSTKRGAGLEFSDYREYAPGDDLRRLDWNLYARSDRPFIKLMEEEEDLAVHLLVDASGSMGWGTGEKFAFALQLALALGAISLAAGEQLIVSLLRDGVTELRYGPARGAHHLLRLYEALASCRPGSATQLNRSLAAYALQSARPGLVMLLSDLLDPGGVAQGIRRLRSRGHEVKMIHLMAPEEIDPPLVGDLRLVDVETQAAVEATLDEGLRRVYRDRLRDWRGEIESECRRQSTGYLFATTETPWEAFVLSDMRKAGFVR